MHRPPGDRSDLRIPTSNDVTDSGRYSRDLDGITLLYIFEVHHGQDVVVNCDYKVKQKRVRTSGTISARKILAALVINRRTGP